MRAHEVLASGAEVSPTGGVVWSMLWVPDDIRIRLGQWGTASDSVLVEQLTTRRRWQVSRATAAVVVAFSGGRSRTEGVEYLERVLEVDLQDLELLVDHLLAVGMLTDSKPTGRSVADHWQQHGWVAAYDHHLATFDYPLVDYSLDGWATDRVRMAEYARSQPDPGVAHDTNGVNRRQVLGLDAARGQHLPAAIGDVIDGPAVRQLLTAERLAVLLSKTFCFVEQGPGRKIRRTSPSGGARHPVEGYVVTHDVQGLPNGLYQVDAVNACLRKVSGSVGREWSEANLEGLFMAPFQPQAVIVITAVFFRNMYRYREPRTFRTVFMDAGHLLGTAEIVAGALGLESFVHHAANDGEIERMLGVRPLREGVVGGIAVAGSDE